MDLRALAGRTARLNAGLWREIARAVDSDQGLRSNAAHSGDGSQAQPSTAAQVPDVGDAGAADRSTMVVPIDTWTRILEQLGNLHQAGQELAEARERAARAETEAAFLREQLAQTRSRSNTTARSQRRRTQSPAEPPVPAEPPPSEPDEVVSPPRRAPLTQARSGIRQARSRVSDWLRPSDAVGLQGTRAEGNAD